MIAVCHMQATLQPTSYQTLLSSMCEMLRFVKLDVNRFFFRWFYFFLEGGLLLTSMPPNPTNDPCMYIWTMKYAYIAKLNKSVKLCMYVVVQMYMHG